MALLSFWISSSKASKLLIHTEAAFCLMRALNYHLSCVKLRVKIYGLSAPFPKHSRREEKVHLLTVLLAGS